MVINLSLGEDGIFKRAEEVTSIYENASQNEILQIDKVTNYIDN